MEAFGTLNLKGSPVDGLRLVNDESYGLHFENDAKVYSVSR